MPPHFIADVETVPDDADAQLTSSSVDGRTVYSVKDMDEPTAGPPSSKHPTAMP